ncbi:putative bacteriophage protein (plasmid) [Rahnella aceris]|uniref:Putative bacteriophage protein n=1 Tax=Rahnella sp. (strain Y9602) TaxID=2703885 RepID=A0A0H3FIH3_RAHSY|nr:hypothetical protein [Rahnella aceris]ADW76565.1 putative bacteriophage protein [Rahnella aceris]
MTNPEESGLERDFCAGQLSLRDLAAIYGITEGAIRKRAKKHGWVRGEKKGTQKSTQVRKDGTQKKEVRTTKNPASSDNSKTPSRRESDAPENTKPIRGSRTAPPVNAFQPGNQAALKHGGYARRLLLSDEVIEDAKALTLDDELFRLRAANLVASENIGRWISQLEDAEKDEVKILLEKIRAAENAMMRNTVRIESIEYTLVVMGKGRADTTYREATTEKVELEVGKLKLQLGKNTPDDPGGIPSNPTTDEAADAYRRLMG